MRKGILFTIAAASIILLFCREKGVTDKKSVPDIKIADYEYSDFENPLPIPTILNNSSTDPKRASFALSVQKGETEFFKGAKVITLGYNGSILGPTIRFRRGQNVDIAVTNRLHEVTTVHWHGMLVPGVMDGGPHQIITPGSVWHPRFKVDQQAATAWYHPHGIGTTALQVYRGLAGLIIVDDDISDRLNIPKDYGINDIPLIIQDRRFTSEGMPVYLTGMMDLMEGMKGNTILTNGTVNPVLKAKKIKYRFRLLNGSNARVYEFRFSDGTKFSQIATDGGFLEKPNATERIKLSPGERAEIIVDFSRHALGSKIFLTSGGFDIVKIAITGEGNDTTIIPAELAKINWIPESASSGERYFSLEGMGANVSINGKQMNMERIDEYVKGGTTETWNIRSLVHGMGMMGGGMMGGRGMMGGNVIHNFHAHGVQFQIVQRGRHSPAPSERGWKDTISLDEGEPVKVLVRFLYKGLFMYHCHILEHEDSGMMGQFRVE